MADGIDLNYSEEKGSLAKDLEARYTETGPERVATSISACSSCCRLAEAAAR